MPAPGSVAEAFGCLYVLEGATLGGQVISRHLARELSLSPANGAAFFNGYGPETGPRWTAFLALLEAHAGQPEQQASVVEAARQTFLLLEQWLREHALLG